jgi:hypothetical protein
VLAFLSLHKPDRDSRRLSRPDAYGGNGDTHPADSRCGIRGLTCSSMTSSHRRLRTMIGNRRGPR